MEFISGIESVLAEERFALLLQAVRDRDHELDVYRRWSGSRRVDGIVIVDVTAADPRLALAALLRLPAVVAGPPDFAGGFPCVWTHDDVAVRQAVEYLAELGHRRIARAAGPPQLAHSLVRRQAFEQAAADHQLSARTVVTDFSNDGARAAMLELLTTDPRPTAVLFDDDLSAVIGLGVAHELGVAVPDELSLLAWDDSVLCRSTHPQLSAMSHDVVGYGAEVARRLLDSIAGSRPAAQLDATPHLVPRGSTAQWAGAAGRSGRAAGL
jgi:DNA-binding LacI/PurR family transcriptional regulator